MATYNIGSGGDFTTLTQVVNKLNGVGVSGAVTITLTDSSYSTNETFPIVINSVPGASALNTITIKTAASNTVSISGSSTTSIFKLNGADFVTIDGSNSGGTDRSLTMTNTNTGTSSAVLWVASASGTDGATNNTVKNCIFTGNAPATTLMGIYSGGATIGTSTPVATNNNGNTYRNNQVSLAQYGIFINGVSTSSLDTGLQVIANNVGTSTNALNTNGILVQFQTGASIQQNVVQNVVGNGGILDAGGSATVFTGIYLRQSRLSTVNANFISNINFVDLTSSFFNRQYALSVESRPSIPAARHRKTSFPTTSSITTSIVARVQPGRSAVLT